MKPILEIPRDVQTVEQLIMLLNDRFRDLDVGLQRVVENPARAKIQIDVNGNRVVDLADPSNDLDAVNLRTLRKFAGQAPKQEQAQVATSSGLDTYTAVFSKDGVLSQSEDSPSYIVQKGREGSPYRAWARSKLAPNDDCVVNFTITYEIGGTPETLLSEDLTIPAGSTDPVFSSDLAVSKRMTEGAAIDLVIVQAGGADLFSAGVGVRRS